MFSNQVFTKITIILFNLAPIIGVAFYNWSPFEMFWLFWMETLILSFFNAIKILFSQQHESGESVMKQSFQINLFPAIGYFMVRFFIFIFYAIFIIVFIGMVSQKEKDPLLVLRTLTFQNVLFNLALLLIFSMNVIYLVKFFFLNGAYLYSKKDEYPGLFDGRQIVIHIGIVLGAVGSAFLFSDSDNSNLASVWVISILSIAKCIFELYFPANRYAGGMSASVYE